ncbi:twin-arginine translocase subunit TatB [Psychromonas sp. psych-6C06]|uniref:Sec-independent protein translocase protein TatB n=1 Tax=Psychromonas sp. psych-6C06 TaxID=2058089 RepID=UPI000C33BB57|nr:Sec-independent protein translocase protein TatB [Psychromonas sp. psych-6C06]PKF61280.1 twin-arginine translocase subunit TatB [Psychromonas sp. psych-6C06]
MFDIGFWEIALISVVGLIVLGPERLPTAIRSVMQWINTAKNMANSVKSEISQELKLHELNEMNDNMIKASKEGVEILDDDMQASIDEMKKNAQELVNPYKKESKPTADETGSNKQQASEQQDKK